MQKALVLLVVDDDPTIRSLVVDILTFEGYILIQATNGAEALDMLQALSRDNQPLPELILLDLQMPIMSGWTFMEHLREDKNQIPIIIMSAQKSLAVQAVQVGAAVDHVHKPFNIDELLRTLSHYLDHNAPNSKE